MRKKALFIANNYWSTPFQVGTHEIAGQFIKHGWEVAYISDPVSPFHLLAKNDPMVLERFNIWKSGGLQFNEQLWTYVPLSLTPPTQSPFTKLKYFLVNWYKFTFPDLIKTVRENNFDDVNLLYIDNIYQSFWMNNIKYSKSIFRITDNNVGFGKLDQKTVIELEKRIASKADLTVYPSEILEEQIKLIDAKKPLLLSNGVNYEHFARKVSKEPDELNDIPHPRIIYVGAMDFWFDFDLINYAAQQRPDFHFILIGNDQLANKMLISSPNIHVLGTRPYSTIPAYLQYSDIGIIPFNQNKYPELVNAINPLKLYQYMASGLQTLSVRWTHLEKIKSPAVLYSGKEEFINSLVELIEKPIDKAELMNFAAKQDWSKKYEILIKELGL